MLFDGSCQRCGLHAGCTSYCRRASVHGQAPVDILLIGKCPDLAADQSGDLLAGEQGKFLMDFLGCWDGPWAYTNVCACRTPNDRDPEPQEIACCEPRLTEEISLLRPKVIMLLGGTALNAVWPDGPKGVGKARQQPAKLGNCWVITTYHPSNHIAGRRNLTDEYTRAFEMAGRIVTGQYRDEYPDIRYVETEADLRPLYEAMAQSSHVYLDFENNTHEGIPGQQTIWMPNARVICCGFGTGIGQPVYVVPDRLLKPEICRLMYGRTVVGHNLKYDGQHLAHFLDRDIWDHIDIADTMLMHSCLDQGKIGNGLKDLAGRFFGVGDWSLPVWALINEENKRREKAKIKTPATFADIPYQVVAEYNGKDVYYTMRLYQHLLAELPPRPVYGNLLLPMTKMLARTELNGLPADPKMRDALRVAVSKKIGEQQQWLRRRPEVQQVEQRRATTQVFVAEDGTTKHAKGKAEEFNGNSYIHLENLLDVTDIEVEEKTTRKVVINGVERLCSKMDKEILAELALAHPVFNVVLRQRQNKNLISKFVDPYGAYISPDGRIHTNYHVAKVEVSGFEAGSDQEGGADTGRLSASDPALHNIKKEPLLRLMFGGLPGYYIVEFDYGQIEPRIAAHLSGCRALIEACSAGDIYREMCAMCHDKPVASVTDAERKLMKVGVLAAVLYGESARSFAKREKIMEHEAEEFFTKARKRFPEVPAFQQESILAARAGEKLTTLWGRVMTFEYTGNSGADGHTDRKAVNFLVQSPASDNTQWKAIISEREDYFRQVLRVNLVHDADYLLIPEERLEEVAHRHRAVMESNSLLPYKLDVPTPVEVKYGRNLGEMETWKC